MFPTAYFALTFFAPRYWPKVGAAPPIPPIPPVVIGGGGGSSFGAGRVVTRPSRIGLIRTLFERLGRLRDEQESERIRRIQLDDEEIIMIITEDDN